MAAGGQSSLGVSSPASCPAQSSMSVLLSPAHALSLLPRQAQLPTRSFSDHTIHDFYKDHECKVEKQISKEKGTAFPQESTATPGFQTQGDSTEHVTCRNTPERHLSDTLLAGSSPGRAGIALSVFCNFLSSTQMPPHTSKINSVLTQTISKLTGLQSIHQHSQQLCFN